MNVKHLVQGRRKWAAIALATVLVGGITAGAVASGGGNDVEPVTSSTKAKPKTTPSPSPEPVETPEEAPVKPETSTEAPSPAPADAAPSSGSTPPRKATQAPAAQAAPAAPAPVAPAPAPAPAPQPVGDGRVPAHTVTMTACQPFNGGTQVLFTINGGQGASTPTRVTTSVAGYGDDSFTVPARIGSSGNNFPSVPYTGPGQCSVRLG